MQKVEEEGEIVMVKEHRELDRTGTRKGHIVIKVHSKKVLSIELFTSNLLHHQKDTWQIKQLYMSVDVGH